MTYWLDHLQSGNQKRILARSCREKSGMRPLKRSEPLSRCLDPLRAVKRGSRPVSGAGKSCCMTMQDTLPSVNPYILSFPGFSPDAGKMLLSPVFSL